MTETLKRSDIVSRLVKVFSKLPSLKLLDGHQGLLSGYMNGSPDLVVPDTGSEFIVISASYAAKLRLKILRDYEWREVAFMDGSTVFTDGMVRDVEWKFRIGDQSFQYDFHIINNLAVDVIVSNKLIYDFDVYASYEDRLISTASDEDMTGIYSISLRQTRAEVKFLEYQFVRDFAYSPSNLFE